MGQVKVHRSTQTPSSQFSSAANSPRNHFIGHHWDFWAIRLTLIGAACLLSYNLRPFGFRGVSAIIIGALIGVVILLAELRLRRAAFSGLMGGTLGVVVGLLTSLLITLVISRTAEPEATKSFLEFTSLFSLAYLGLAVGSSTGQYFQHIPLPNPMALPTAGTQPVKLIDTSALIDGRIADICETHFLDGALGVPRFVLHELQLVADSSDPLKRQRGRRGIEVLQRMQKMGWLEIRIVEEDVPGAAGVDQKLVDLARQSGSKIVTNDFNLNKVARVQGISVLNVNELANAMKPAVLPGESMRVLILREGKELNQGVAYLDDGTMVVVDGARRLINRTVEIVVTSTHQTPAGKMIFGRLDERSSSGPPESVTAAGDTRKIAGPPAPPRFDSASSSAYSGHEPQ